MGGVSPKSVVTLSKINCHGHPRHFLIRKCFITLQKLCVSKIATFFGCEFVFRFYIQLTMKDKYIVVRSFRSIVFLSSDFARFSIVFCFSAFEGR